MTLLLILLGINALPMAYIFSYTKMSKSNVVFTLGLLPFVLRKFLKLKEKFSIEGWHHVNHLLFLFMSNIISSNTIDSVYNYVKNLYKLNYVMLSPT